MYADNQFEVAKEQIERQNEMIKGAKSSGEAA
jgi:hypothetical protein